MTELVVHIGQGKTGSTSIQRTLDAGREELLRRGIAYLGRTLEHCTAREPFAWQTAEGAEHLLHRMDEARASDEIHEVLSAELDALETSGVRTAIWSNEALFMRNAPPIAALEKLRGAGGRIRAVLYLRRHDHWARSAYAQWGIRHKAYEGPVLPFADWVKARPVRFAGALSRWDAALGNAIELRNFHAVGDVVEDFLELTGARGLAPVRAYDTPPPQTLVAWALYNSIRDEQMQPDRFARILNAAGLSHTAPPDIPAPGALLPGDADLARLLRDSAEDIAAVNAAFRARGQPEFDVAVPASAAAPPDPWQMLQLTMTMVFSLQEQVLALRRRINDLENGG